MAIRSGILSWPLFVIVYSIATTRIRGQAVAEMPTKLLGFYNLFDLAAFPHTPPANGCPELIQITSVRVIDDVSVAVDIDSGLSFNGAPCSAQTDGTSFFTLTEVDTPDLVVGKKTVAFPVYKGSIPAGSMTCGGSDGPLPETSVSVQDSGRMIFRMYSFLQLEAADEQEEVGFVPGYITPTLAPGAEEPAPLAPLGDGIPRLRGTYSIKLAIKGTATSCTYMRSPELLNLFDALSAFNSGEESKEDIREDKGDEQLSYDIEMLEKKEEFVPGDVRCQSAKKYRPNRLSFTVPKRDESEASILDFKPLGEFSLDGEACEPLQNVYRMKDILRMDDRSDPGIALLFQAILQQFFVDFIVGSDQSAEVARMNPPEDEQVALVMEYVDFFNNMVWAGVMTSGTICGDRTLDESFAYLLINDSPFDRIEEQRLDLIPSATIDEVELKALMSFGSLLTAYLFHEGQGERCIYTNSVDAANLLLSERNGTSSSQSGDGSSGATPPTELPKTEFETDLSACFPGTSKVQLIDGTFIRMEELRVGDQVLVSQNSFSKVLLLTHADTDIVSDFMSIRTAAGDIFLSPGHYLPVNGKLTAAQAVRVGDKLDSLVNGTRVESSVRSIRVVKMRGLFNPQTVSGDIAVFWSENAILASVYTTAVHPRFAHALLAPLRWLDAITGLTITSISDALSKPSELWTSILPQGSLSGEL